MNELVEIIKESLPFIVLAKQRHFVEKYEAVALLYDLPFLVISCKYYYLPNITFIFFLNTYNLKYNNVLWFQHHQTNQP